MRCPNTRVFIGFDYVTVHRTRWLVGRSNNGHNFVVPATSFLFVAICVISHCPSTSVPFEFSEFCLDVTICIIILWVWSQSTKNCLLWNWEGVWAATRLVVFANVHLLLAVFGVLFPNSFKLFSLGLTMGWWHVAWRMKDSRFIFFYNLVLFNILHFVEARGFSCGGGGSKKEAMKNVGYLFFSFQKFEACKLLYLTWKIQKAARSDVLTHCLR